MAKLPLAPGSTIGILGVYAGWLLVRLRRTTASAQRLEASRLEASRLGTARSGGSQ